ncbi:response regulator [Arenibaculum pallidiluteum]|uniref:response regulator n=1 Tax=Arenibaculum pallidiluteum TaxID=2812559 RepID=UPI001A964B1F|nr:response regulator transcription factor [Arenibaculum pallidiluteum]
MRVLVVDDHAIVRGGLCRLFASDPEVEVVEAASGREALSLFRARPPRLVVLDLNLPGLGGLELIRRLRAEAPATPILVFSMHAEAIYVTRALEAGAAGFVSKNAAPEELLEAMRRVTAGERYLERELAQQLALQNVAGSPGRLDDLSRRELEILRLLGEGKGLPQIAESIGISYKTVANTCGMIKTKLGVSRTAELIRIAIECGVSRGLASPEVGSAAPPATD